MSLKRISGANTTDVDIANAVQLPSHGCDAGGGLHIVIPDDWQERIAAGQHVPGCTYSRLEADGSMEVSDFVQRQIAIPAVVQSLTPAQQLEAPAFVSKINSGVVIDPSPDTMPGLALWLDGRTANAFSDAAGAARATATGRVHRVDQTPPLTGSWLAPSTATRVFREIEGACFDVAGSATAIAAPAGVSLPANNATIGFSFTRRDARGGGPEYLLIGNDGTARWGFYCFSNNIHIFYQGLEFDTGIACLMNVPITGIVRWTPTGVDILCDVGGVSQSASVAGTLTARTASGFKIGLNSDSSFGFVDGALIAAVSQITGHTRAINDTERADLLAWLLRHRAPTTMPLLAPYIAVEGDSISTSGLNFYTRDSYVFRMLAGLWAASDVRLEDYAISGSFISTVQARVASTVLPMLSAARAKNIVILCIGTNSLGNERLKTATQYWADYQALADSIRAAGPPGVRIVGTTVLPRTVGAFGTPASFESDRQTFNALVRTNAGAHFDAIADQAAVVGMGAAGDDTNTTNYLDGVHPSAAGMAILAPNWIAALTPFV